MIDEIDRAILSQLSKDAGISNKTLAGMVGLSPSSCLERVRRLRLGGVIKGIYADVDSAKLGINIEALLFIGLVKHSGLAVRDFFERALKVLSGTLSLTSRSGEHDVSVEAGACLLEVDSQVSPEAHPLAHLSAGVCE